MERQPGTVPGAILELHAGWAALGTGPGVNSPLTTQWQDKSGSGNHGTLTTFAGTTASGWAGTGTLADPYRLAFDGTDYVALSSLNSSGDGIFTWEAWFKTSAAAQLLIFEYTGWMILRVNATGQLYALMAKSDWSESAIITSASTYNDGLIHHVVVVGNGSNLTLYVDNASQGSSGALPTLQNKTVTGIGGPSAGFGTLEGSILVNRIYPFALTPAQVAQNYAAGYLWAAQPFTSLLDGGLSVEIAGVERRSDVHGLELESTLLGDGAASFWVEVLDPLSPQAAYPAGFPELLHGATVAVDHTLNGVATPQYRGYVLTDTRTGYAGEKAVVTVECGGVLDVAKNRTDLGFIFTDTDESQWFANKRNPKCYSVDASDRIDIRVGDDTKVPHDKAGICGYVPYLGAEHLLIANGGPMTGVKRIKGTVSYDLRDHMNGALIWVAKYTNSLNASGAGSPYTVIHQWTTDTKGDNKEFNYTLDALGHAIGGANGAGYVALALWSNKAGGTKTTAERFIQIENCVVYTGTVEKTIDEAMLSVAGIVGLHTSTASSNIGAPLASLVARPYVDPVAALADFATQAEVLVEWGYHQGQFRARPLPTHPLTIRALANCYSIDPEDPRVVWDVSQHPENYIARAVRLIYGRIGKTAYPAGTPAQVISLDPGWTTGTAFMGGTSPVLTVDWSGKNLSSSRALTLARRLASHLGAGESSGSVSLTGVTVPVSSGGTKPVPYLHGGDWVECTKGGAGPLLITRAHVVVDTGYVDMDVGLADGLLLEQLIAAGLAGRKVDPMRPHHPRSFHPQASKERGNR